LAAGLEFPPGCFLAFLVCIAAGCSAAAVFFADAAGDGFGADGFLVASPRHAVPYALGGRASLPASAAADVLALAAGCAATGRSPGNSQTQSPSAAMPPARIMNRRRQ
jgi:hypothetical protein